MIGCAGLERTPSRNPILTPTHGAIIISAEEEALLRYRFTARGYRHPEVKRWTVCSDDDVIDELAMARHGVRGSERLSEDCPISRHPYYFVKPNSSTHFPGRYAFPDRNSCTTKGTNRRPCGRVRAHHISIIANTITISIWISRICSQL